jgi:hypothetical protein
MTSEPTVDVARVHACPLNPDEALLGTSTPSTNASSLQDSQQALDTEKLCFQNAVTYGVPGSYLNRYGHKNALRIG